MVSCALKSRPAISAVTERVKKVIADAVEIHHSVLAAFRRVAFDLQILIPGTAADWRHVRRAGGADAGEGAEPLQHLPEHGLATLFRINAVAA